LSPALRGLFFPTGTMTDRVSDDLSVALWATNLGRPLTGLDQWIATVDEQMRKAVAAGASILVMPEHCAEQWLCYAPAELRATDEIPWLADQTRQALASLGALPANHGIALLAGSMPTAVDRGVDGAPPFVNRAHLLLPDGRVIVHDKLCLTPSEHDPRGWHLSTGARVSVVTWQGLRIAVLICLDIELPAIAPRLAALEPDLVLVPSMTEHLSGYHRVFGCARARAVELFTTVCAVGCVGSVPAARPRSGNVSGASVFIPCELDLGSRGVVAEVPPMDRHTGLGPVLFSPPLPLKRIRELRHASAEVWPGAWNGSGVEVIQV
jgi:predicted amidohydrolase